MQEPYSGVPTQPISADEIRPELFERFRPQFDACLALHGFLKGQRSSQPPTNDAAGMIILWTYEGSSKTFQRAVRLAGLGYGEQAGMLNRSLYEDMLIAHWVKRHPEAAAERIGQPQRFTLAKWGNALRSHGLVPPGKSFPQLEKGERRGPRAL